MRIILYSLFFKFFYVIIAFKRNSIDGDYKINMFNENGSYSLEKNLIENIIWIQFQSVMLPTKSYWLKIKRKTFIEYPVIVKSLSRGHYNLSTTPRSIDCHFEAVSHFVTHTFAAKQRHENNPSVTGLDYSPISLCDGISGIVSVADDSSLVRIESNSRGQLDTVHLTHIHRLASEEVQQLNGYGQFRDIAERKVRQSYKLQRVKRSFRLPIHNIPGPFLVELYLVVDSKMASMYGGDNYSRLLSRITTILNQINVAFMQFNIYFTVVQLEIWEQDPIKLTDEHHIIMELQLYKRQFIDKRHDCLHAILGENLGSAKRGQSEPASMCAYNRCVGYTKDHLGLSEIEIAHSVIHEIGHNFGINHDTEECKCYGCIMATGVENAALKYQWSTCSRKQISSRLKSGMADCLKDIPQSEFGNVQPIIMSQNKKSKLLSELSLPKCGNGVVDDGEQCDCGGRELCSETARRCCNPDTCRLLFGAQCASGECCDLSRCSIRFAGTVCRYDSNRHCDLPEFCNGVSEWCPSDVYKYDGSPCTTSIIGDSSRCYYGECNSRQSWCRVLFGDTASEAPPECYKMNKNGDNVRNCGLYVPSKEDRSTQPRFWQPRPCNDDNLICGRLWCSHFNERMLRSSPQFEVNDEVGNAACSAARFYLDWNLDDAGLVPNGSPCNNGKMCWRGTCVSPMTVDMGGCYCNGHGVCNNRQHCHCDPGFAPPNCTSLGNGGSVDSGSPLKFNQPLRMIVAGVFIAIIAFIAIFVCAVLIYHYNTRRWPTFLAKMKWPDYQKSDFIIKSKVPNENGRSNSKYIRCSISQSDQTLASIRSPRSPIPIISDELIYANSFFSVNKGSAERSTPKSFSPVKSKAFMLDNVPEDEFINFQNPQLNPLKPQTEKPVSNVHRSFKPPISNDKPVKNISSHLKPPASNEKPVKIASSPFKPPVSEEKPVKNISSPLKPPVSEEKPLKNIIRPLKPPVSNQKPMKIVSSPLKPPVSQDKPIANINTLLKPPVSKLKPVKGSNVSHISSQLNQSSKPLEIKPSLLKNERDIVAGSPNFPTNNNPTAKTLLLSEKPKKSINENRKPILLPGPSVLNIKPSLKTRECNDQVGGSTSSHSQPIKLDKGIDSTKKSKAMISQPRLDQTTCNALTRELSSPDQTLSRFVGPHKIIKIDSNTAIKYLY